MANLISKIARKLLPTNRHLVIFKTINISMPTDQAAGQNIALLKNIRDSGADGLLKQSLFESNQQWTVFGFERPSDISMKSDASKFEGTEHISTTGGLISRVLPLVRMYRRIRTHCKKDCRQISTLIAGSLEAALILELVTRTKCQKYYLFSDLTRFHAGRVSSIIIGFIEGFCIKRGWTVCITSPGFYEGYLCLRFGASVKTLLVQNYAPNLLEVSRRFKVSDFQETRKIIWIGLLRGKASVRLFHELLQRQRVNWELTLGGDAAFIEGSEFTDLLSNYSGTHKVKWTGRYVNDDIAALYSDQTFTWACDWEDEGLNSMLLLPNRLYQGIAMGCPIIASEGSWVAKVVAAYGIGLSIPLDFKLACDILESITLPDYEKYCKNIALIRKFGANHENGWPAILRGMGQQINECILRGQIFDEYPQRE